MVQKLRISPVYWLHSFAIFSGWISGAADATDVKAKTAQTDATDSVLMACSLGSTSI